MSAGLRIEGNRLTAGGQRPALLSYDNQQSQARPRGECEPLTR
jgi:hypothetical protein